MALELLKLLGTVEPDDVVLLTAPTGVAAFIISGMTLYSALLPKIRWFSASQL